MPKNKNDIFNLSLNADLVVLSACQAQLQLQQEDEWAAPYFWAAFTLQGEWR